MYCTYEPENKVFLCILRVQISAAYTGKCFQKPCVQPTRLCFWGVQKLFQGWNVSASRRHRLCVCSFHTLSLFPGYSMHIKNREVNVSPFSWVLCCWIWNSWTWKILTDDCHQNEIGWVISQAHQSWIRKQYIKSTALKARYKHDILNRKYSLSPQNDHFSQSQFLNPNLISSVHFSDYETLMQHPWICCSYDKNAKCF